jgi:hypothetical protein
VFPFLNLKLSLKSDRDPHCARAFLFYDTDLERLQGERDATRFMDECVKAGMPAEMYAGARPAGSLWASQQ